MSTAILANGAAGMGMMAVVAVSALIAVLAFGLIRWRQRRRP
jgi:hypothetical protein